MAVAQPPRTAGTPTDAAGPESPDASVRPVSPDAPVRIEVAMPRALFDRLTDHDEAPRCRYDQHAGIAEFVAEPTFAHEGPAWEIGQLFARMADALADRGRDVSWQPSGALRLLSDDGAFEADASFYLDPESERATRQVEGYLDVRTGLPAPDLVVEIDRSRRSRHKLAPYFRMGVREVWTSDRKEGIVIWTPDPSAAGGLRPAAESAILPGLTCDDLAPLLMRGDPLERARHSRRLARRVAARLTATPAR